MQYSSILRNFEYKVCNSSDQFAQILWICGSSEFMYAVIRNKNTNSVLRTFLLPSSAEVVSIIPVNAVRPDLTQPDQEKYRNSFLQQKLLCKTFSTSVADSIWKTTSISFPNGRQTQFSVKWKTTSIVFKWKTTSIVFKWKMTLILFYAT